MRVRLCKVSASLIIADKTWLTHSKFTSRLFAAVFVKDLSS